MATPSRGCRASRPAGRRAPLSVEHSELVTLANPRSPYIDVRKPMDDLTDLVEIGDDEPFILHPGEFVLGSTLETLTLLIAPMMPHLAESCWNALGHETLVIDRPWPVADPVLVRSDTITVAVQVDGKRRGEITIARESEDESVRAAALQVEAVARALAGRQPRRIIVVPQRIVNIVT